MSKKKEKSSIEKAQERIDNIGDTFDKIGADNRAIMAATREGRMNRYGNRTSKRSQASMPRLAGLGRLGSSLGAASVPGYKKRA